MEQEKNILSDTTGFVNIVPVISASEKCPSIIIETYEVQPETDPVDNVGEKKGQCCSTASSIDYVGSKEDLVSKLISTAKSPNEKKLVSFADERGLDLQVVRHFCKNVLPEISKSAFDDLDVPQGSSDEPLARRAKNRLKSKRLTFIPLFQQPGSDPHFFNRVRKQNVCLENILINGRTVKGIVMVSNLGYQKRVRVRFTTNGWKTKTHISARFVSSDSIYNSSDRFEFVINAPLMPIGARLVFVIKYVVNGSEFWDNNFGYDYALSCVINNR